MNSLVENDAETECFSNQPVDCHEDGAGNERDSIISSDSSRWKSREMAPPRLSLKPGTLSSKGRVEKWREWTLKGGIDFEEVTIVASIEDTGAFLVYFLFMIDLGSS